MRSAGGVAAHELTISGAWRDAPPITFVDHYASHIGNSYFMSTFDDAALAVIDGRAESSTSLFGSATGVDITTACEVRYPHSLGLFYGAITQFLGYRPDSDEWKVMALASFADADNEFLPMMSELVRVRPDGTFELALEYFEFYNQFDGRMFSDKLVDAVRQASRARTPSSRCTSGSRRRRSASSSRRWPPCSPSSTSGPARIAWRCPAAAS